MAGDHPVRELRDQLTHAVYITPELVATAPNQRRSQDNNRLLGPQKWTYCYLYVLIDIFSRDVVGWMSPTPSGSGALTDRYSTPAPGPVPGPRGADLPEAGAALATAGLRLPRSGILPE